MYLWQEYVLKCFPSKHKTKFRLHESFAEMCMYLLHLPLQQMKGFQLPGSFRGSYFKVCSDTGIRECTQAL